MTIERYATGGVDLTLDTHVGLRGLRVWAEGLVGGSWLEHSRKPTDDRAATFAAGRVVAAVRTGGRKKRDFYVEPYGMVGVFDPDTEVAFDLAWEETVGVNVGGWKVFRVGVEGHHAGAERNLPRVYGLGDPDRIEILLQAGAAF